MLRRLAMLVPFVALGCSQLIGLDGFKESPEATGGTSATGGAAGNGGSSASGGSAGDGGSSGSAGSGATSGSGGTGGVAPDCSQPEDCVDALGECDDKWTCPAGKCVKEFKAGGDTCSLGICSGKGGCGECVADSRRCSTTELGRPEVCDDTGHWVGALTCSGDKPICDEGSCLGVTQLSLGTTHNCALLTDGQVRCWGQNSAGQLGIGSKSSEEFRPVKVAGIANAVEVAAGSELSCARLANSEVWCWGLLSVSSTNPGENFSEEWLAPHKIGDNAEQLAVSAGPCYLSDGRAFCMGEGTDGNGDFGQESGEGGSPVLEVITGLSGLRQITRSYWAICGLQDSAITCAGVAAGSPPTNGVGPDTTISSGFYGSCEAGKTQAGTILCWGGQVSTPRFGVDSPFDAVKPSLGFDHACAISSGTAYCWGASNKGQCGEDRTVTSDVPNAVVSGVEDVYAGNKISCAKKTDGSVVCWGAITSTDVGYQPRPIQWN